MRLGFGGGSGSRVWGCCCRLLGIGFKRGVRTLPLICVTLGRSLGLLEPQFCHLYMGLGSPHAERGHLSQQCVLRVPAQFLPRGPGSMPCSSWCPVFLRPQLSHVQLG